MSYRIGIDLGGTNIKVGIVDEQNNLIKSHSRPTHAKRPAEQIIEDIADACQVVAKEAGIDIKQCISCGIGSPGSVDSKTGVVVYSNNLSWENVPIAQELSERLGIDVKASNDANCAALGEFVAGAAKHAQSAVMLTLGTGIGSGIVIDGKLFEGGGPGGAEFGHTVMVCDGEECTCGRKGCVEAYCSATALIRDAKKAAQSNPSSMLNKLCGNLDEMNGLIPFQAAQAGDAVAGGVIDNYIGWLSEAIVNIINLFRPEMVLLSGGICGQGKKLTDPINQCVQQKSYGGSLLETPEIERATLGNNAGIIGAANL